MKRPLRLAAPIALAAVLGMAAPAMAQFNIQYSVPGLSIGVNLGGYPTLQRIPGYPVYYAPNLDRNYFFYDGLYWVYENDNWYSSSWYNGPWSLVDPFYVPDYVLRVPVRYYRHAPTYFRSWRADAPPRWHEHWGRSWEDRRRGWDRWDRRNVPAAAPLPTYQREYRGDRYPDVSRQAWLERERYRYQPRDDAARRQWEHRGQLARDDVNAGRRDFDRRNFDRRGEFRETTREGLPVPRDEARREEIRRRDPREANREQRLDPQGQGRPDPSHSGG